MDVVIQRRMMVLYPVGADYLKWRGSFGLIPRIRESLTTSLIYDECFSEDLLLLYPV